MSRSCPGPDVSPALQSHEDLFEVIKSIRSMPDHPRQQLAQKVFDNYVQRSKQPSSEDLEHAINLAVRVMTMVNCSTQCLSPGLLEHGAFQIRWPRDVTFSQFIAYAFPMTDHPVKSALTANKLKKRARLTFRPTDDFTQPSPTRPQPSCCGDISPYDVPEGAFETDQGPGQCDLGD
jgi:hypothetical protein